MKTKNFETPRDGDVASLGDLGKQLFYISYIDFGDPWSPTDNGFVFVYPLFERIKEGGLQKFVAFSDSVKALSLLRRVPPRSLTKKVKCEIGKIRKMRLRSRDSSIDFVQVDWKVEDYVDRKKRGKEL